MNRGDIYWVEWPRIGRRPGVVITRNDLIPFLANSTLALVTSNTRGVSTEIPLDKSNGLKVDSSANCLNLMTIEKSEIGSRIGRLNPEQLFHLDIALRIALQLDD